MSWFEELLQNGIVPGFNHLLLQIKAYGSLIGLSCIIIWLLLLVFGRFLLTIRIKSKLDISLLFTGIILCSLCGWKYGLEFFAF